MDFVNDVDLELRIGGRVFAGLTELADLFDAIIAGAINFQNVERPAFGDLKAAWILVVEGDFRAAFTIQAFGENAGDGGLAGAARAAKQVGVRNALLLDGIGERLRDVFLADDLGETLGPVFPGYDFVRHLQITIYDLRAGLAMQSSIENNQARVTTADVEQTTVAAFRPWRGS